MKPNFAVRCSIDSTRPRFRFAAVVAAVYCAVLSVSCADSGEECTVPKDVEEVRSGMPETIPTELPVYGATNNCSEPPEPLTICEWATAPDAIVFAKVVDTRGFENPAEQNGGVTSTCPRAEPGFALDIRVLETIHGSAPPELTIRIGQEPLSTWEDIPRLDRDDLENPTWGSSATARVLPGMVYGLALYDVGESWTPATEPWFARTASNGLTVMDGTRELCRAAPDWLDGMSVADLKAEIANCSGTEGKARRDRVMTAAQAYPDQVYAADCYE